MFRYFSRRLRFWSVFPWRRGPVLGAVEFWWPTGEDLGEVEDAIKDAGVRVALFNFDAGDMAGGDRGLVSDPGRQDQFRENVPAALELARLLECRKMNVLLGHEIEGMSREEQLALARENVGFAADEAHEVGIELVVEAVNTFENGPYLIYTTDEAVGVRTKSGSWQRCDTT